LQCCVACPGLSDKASRPPSLAEWTADGNARAPARKEGRKEGRREGGREGGKEGRKEAESGISGHWTLVESGSPTISS